MKTRPAHNFMIAILLSCTFFFIFATTSKAEGMEFDYHGARFFYGDSNWSIAGPDAAVRYQWFNGSYFAGKNLTEWLSLESQVGAGYLQTESHDETPSIEWLLLLACKNDWAYLNLGGGVAHLFNYANLPDLAESEMYGRISGSIGVGPYTFMYDKTPIELTLGYSIEHLSSPFHQTVEDGDVGWNVGALDIMIKWQF